MKIDQFSSSGVYGPRSTGMANTSAAETQRHQGYSSPGEPSLDRVEVSDLAQKVSALLDRESSMHNERVEQLRSDYQQGVYRVDPSALSQKLLEVMASPALGNS